MVKSRVQKSTHKQGLEAPNYVQDIIRIDRKNGNTTLWKDALSKEVKNVGTAFKILEKDGVFPPGYKKLSDYLIYDIKIDFTQKVRWVKDGHKTLNSETSSYADVVS